LGKAAISLIMEEEVFEIAAEGTISDQYIQKAIVVVISPNHAARVAVIGNDRTNNRGIGQATQITMAFVMIKTDPKIACGSRIKIQQPIVVIICPGATTRTQAANHVGKSTLEGAIAPIMIEEIRPTNIAYKQIGKPIIVVVAPGGTHRRARVRRD